MFQAKTNSTPVFFIKTPNRQHFPFSGLGIVLILFITNNIKFPIILIKIDIMKDFIKLFEIWHVIWETQLLPCFFSFSIKNGYAIRCGELNIIPHVLTTMKTEKVIKQQRSTTIAANFQSLAACSSWKKQKAETIGVITLSPPSHLPPFSFSSLSSVSKYS